MEITARTLARDPERVRRTLVVLRALGVSVSLDDFGTGYSTLAHLKHFAFDSLNTDQTFVRGLGGHDNDGLIVEAVIGLGRALGLAVVAEGVRPKPSWLVSWSSDVRSVRAFSSPVRRPPTRSLATRRNARRHSRSDPATHRRGGRTCRIRSSAGVTGEP